jgi:hypothetical protein
MKLWEVIKELTDDPTKKFERKDRYKHWVIGTDVVGGAISGGTYYFMVDCYGGDSYGGAVRGETYCFSLECEGEDSYGDGGGGTYYFMVTCYGEDSCGDVGKFSGNLANNEDDWQPVRQPVTWQEAIQSWVDGKKVVWEEDGERRVFDRNKSWAIPKYQSHLLDQDGDAVTVRMISGGKWYVED